MDPAGFLFQENLQDWGGEGGGGTTYDAGKIGKMEEFRGEREKERLARRKESGYIMGGKTVGLREQGIRPFLKAALPSRGCCCPQGLQQPLPIGHLQETGW